MRAIGPWVGVLSWGFGVGLTEEQRATLHELLDSSQVLGEAALKGEDKAMPRLSIPWQRQMGKVNFLQQELIRMRASLDQETAPRVNRAKRFAEIFFASPGLLQPRFPLRGN